MTTEFSISTNKRCEMIDITHLIQKAIDQSDLVDKSNGIAFCFVPHTTAALTINENADPDVRHDLLYKLAKEIPEIDGYHHAEGNSDAHLKASLFGSSEQLLIEKGKLLLGRWQGVYFCEFDGPRTRKLIIRISTVA